jgi:oxygen-independent coproporphyrinogen-3 oxidase
MSGGAEAREAAHARGAALAGDQAPGDKASRTERPNAPSRNETPPPRHVYVHVPFCRAKCDYCDFASVAVGDKPNSTLLDQFVAAVAAEWQLERVAHGVRRVHTLYVGGGTPSLLGPARLEKLLEPFRPFLTPHAEVTVEANPEDVTPAFAAWAAGGRAAAAAAGREAAGSEAAGTEAAAGHEAAAGKEATAAGHEAAAGKRAPREDVPPSRLRVSLGVQSFDAGVRDALGRRAVADPAAAFARLRAAGVSELSLDLIFGVPGQTPAMLDADLAAVARLRPAHVSWYELDVVPGTPLAKRRERRPGDDARAELYRRVVAGLARLGYLWYEVSNFALAGHRSRHNLAYWRGRDYLGLGPGAVSTVGARRERDVPDVGTVGARRWRDRPDVSAYCAALAAGREPPRTHERLDRLAQQRERLLLAARIGAPVPLATLAGALDSAALPPLAAAGFISLHGGTLTVTRKGRYVANEVCVRLFRA